MKTTEELIAKYPELCRDAMQYATGVNPGWVPILDELFAELELVRLDDPEFRIDQFKQKFAMLTVYPNKRNAAASMLIDAAVRKADTICEFCGAEKAKEVGHYYIRKLCEECSKVTCKLCEKKVPEDGARRYKMGYLCSDCWDKREEQ